MKSEKSEIVRSQQWKTFWGMPQGTVIRSHGRTFEKDDREHFKTLYNHPDGVKFMAWVRINDMCLKFQDYEMVKYGEYDKFY